MYVYMHREREKESDNFYVYDSINKMYKYIM